MKTMMKLVSLAALGLTIIPSILVYLRVIRWDDHANLMVVGMILWFLSAPVWMKRTEH
jgi:hypothetical protein